MRTSRYALVCACLLCTLGASAQAYVPSQITLETGVHSNRVKISWTTIPGKNYDVLTAEQLGQPWAATNGTVKSRSTLTNFTDPANRLMRLYRIREQATPPGNTGSINATTIAETEKLLGLTFTASQRNQVLQLLFDSSYWANRAAFESMRTNRLLNSDPPALLFNPLPRGFTFDQVQKPIAWSPPPHLALPINLGELAHRDVWFGGQTRNPWNPSEGSSGSSAGSAAATAAGLFPFAIGTETLGSIVFPCTVCRVTGLRPTFGRVSRAGAMTLSWSMDKVGPICRTVEDCAMVLEAIRGVDGADEAAVNPPFNYDPRFDLTALRVGYRAGIPSAVTNRLAAILGPAQLVSIALPRYPNRALSLLILDAEAAAALDPLTRFGADAFLADQGDRGWPNRLRTARTIPAAEYLQANRLRHKLIQDMGALMQTVDVFVDVFDFEQSGYETL